MPCRNLQFPIRCRSISRVKAVSKLWPSKCGKCFLMSRIMPSFMISWRRARRKWPSKISWVEPSICLANRYDNTVGCGSQFSGIGRFFNNFNLTSRLRRLSDYLIGWLIDWLVYFVFIVFFSCISFTGNTVSAGTGNDRYSNCSKWTSKQGQHCPWFSGSLPGTANSAKSTTSHQVFLFCTGTRAMIPDLLLCYYRKQSCGKLGKISWTG